jgi:hypothetical protein
MQLRAAKYVQIFNTHTRSEQIAVRYKGGTCALQQRRQQPAVLFLLLVLLLLECAALAAQTASQLCRSYEGRV